MSPAPAVDFNVAKSLVQIHLRALRKYREEAQDGLAHTVQDCALSVSHAEATLKQFDHECPTPKEIKDAAWNIRERYAESDASQKKKWEAEGYSYDPTFYESIQGQLNIPKGPAQHELMWAAIKAKLQVQNFRDVPLGQCWAAAQELGFPLNHAQQEELNRWRGSHPDNRIRPPVVPTPPIPEAQATASNCAMCKGTGRTDEGSYCTCVTGRDLARVESPVEKSDADEDWDSLPSAE